MSSRRRRHRSLITGFSVAELIFSSFLLLMLLTMAMITIVPGIRVTKTAEESMSAQHQVVHAFDRLFQNVSLLDRGSVTVAEGCLSFLNPEPFTGANPPINPGYLHLSAFRSPQTVWRKFTVLRFRDRSIFHREYPYSEGDVIGRIKHDDLLLVADLPGMQEKRFADDIEEFQVRTVGISRVMFRIRSVYRQAARPRSCDVTFQIVMRGGT